MIIEEQFIPQFGLFVLQTLKKKYAKRTEFYSDFIQTVEQSAPSEIFRLIKESIQFRKIATHLTYRDLLSFFFPRKTNLYDYPTWMTCLPLLSQYAEVLGRIPAILPDLHTCFQDMVSHLGIFVLPSLHAAWGSGVLVFTTFRVNSTEISAPILLQPSNSFQTQLPDLNLEGIPYLQEFPGGAVSNAVQRSSNLSLFSPFNERWIPQFNTWMNTLTLGGEHFNGKLTL